jgi:hypothetical protein
VKDADTLAQRGYAPAGQSWGDGPWDGGMSSTRHPSPGPTRPDSVAAGGIAKSCRAWAFSVSAERPTSRIDEERERAMGAYRWDRDPLALEATMRTLDAAEQDPGGCDAGCGPASLS